MTDASISTSTADCGTSSEDTRGRPDCRNLEREIGSVRPEGRRRGRPRKETGKSDHADGVSRMLATRSFFSEGVTKGEIGVATGLAWTPVGGDVLFVEANTVKARGAITS